MSLGPLVHAAKQPRTDANLEGLSSEGRRRTKIMRTIAPIFLLCKPNMTNSQARSKVGIMRLNLDYKMPVIFGVLAVMTEDQAKERAGLIGTHGNSGKDWGNTAVQLTFFFPYDDKLRS